MQLKLSLWQTAQFGNICEKDLERKLDFSGVSVLAPKKLGQ
jgi:hypothetical protein